MDPLVPQKRTRMCAILRAFAPWYPARAERAAPSSGQPHRLASPCEQRLGRAVGGTVPLLCAHMHADHVSCVIDSYPQRYLWQIMLTFFGCGIAGWCVTRLLRPKEPLAAAAP